MAAAGVITQQQATPSSVMELAGGGLKATSNLHQSRSFLAQTPVHPGSSSGLMSSSSSHKRAKFKLEPLKVLEPSQKKLTLPESQRIMFVLEELIRRLEILDLIPFV